LSDKYPIMGWTIKPVSGAAIQSRGIASLSAPSVWKILDINPPWRANPNCIPRNPKLMFQISQKPNFCFSIIVFDLRYDKRMLIKTYFIFEVSISFDIGGKYRIFCRRGNGFVLFNILRPAVLS